MAIKTFYLINTAYTDAPPFFAITQESAPAAGATTAGWSVGNTSLATPFWKCKAAGTKASSGFAQATSNIDGLTSPFGGASASNTGDSFVTPNSTNGTFAAGNWILNFGLRASVDTGVSTQAGRIRCRVWAAKNINMTGLRELTTTTLVGSTITLVTTGTTYTSQITWNAPAIQLYDEYLFFQIEWNATAVGPTGSDVVFYTSASVMQTTDLSGVKDHILNADWRSYRLGRELNLVEYNNNFTVLHMDGANNATSFCEQSFPNFNPIRRWDAHGVITSTNDAKWGTSAYFNGSSWIDTPIVANNAFNVSGLIYPQVLWWQGTGGSGGYNFNFKVTGGDGTLRYIMGTANPAGANSGFALYLDTSNKLVMRVTQVNNFIRSVTSTLTFTTAANSWTNVRIYDSFNLSPPPRSARLDEDVVITPFIDTTHTITLTVNGTLQNTLSFQANLISIPSIFSIGRAGEYANNYFIGYIDEWYWAPTYISGGITAPVGDFPQTNLRLGRSSLLADQGSYSLSGKDVTFRYTHRLFADKGDYTLIRNQAELAVGRGVKADRGTYVYDGIYGNDRYTKILLHMDGANGGTVFTDSSAGAPIRTWTLNAATTSTLQTKFGNTVGRFPGSSYVMTSPNVNLNLLNNDFTIDCWVYPTVTPQGTYVFSGGSDASGTYATRTIELIVSGTNNLVYFNAFVASTVYQINGPIGIGINSWHHLEGSRSGNTLRLFIDGILVANTTAIGTANINNQPSYQWMVGALHNIGGYFLGFVDEVRYSIGIARHTANFTPPVFPYGIQTFITGKSLVANQGSYTLTGKDTIGKTGYRLLADKGNYSLIGGIGLANRSVLAAKGNYGYDGIYGNDQYTRILLHMDGTEGGTVFTDSSAGAPARTWISVGAVANTTSVQSKWGTAGVFNGTTAHVYTPSAANLNAGAGDWTIDCWVYPTSGTAQFKAIFMGGSDASGTYTTRTIELMVTNTAGNQPYVNVFVGSTLYSTAAVSLLNTGSWRHLEVSRSGGFLRMFIDGVLQGTPTAITGSINNGSGNWMFGAFQNYGYYYNGYIDELRYSVGIARHTTNFTPPVAPYGFHNFITGKSLIANQGSYSLSGKDANSRFVYRCLAQSVFYNIFRTPAGLAVGRQVKADKGNFLYIPTEGNDEYTMSLLHMEGANTGTVFIDSAKSVPRIWTATSATTRTTDSKFGNSSYFSGGTGQRIDTPVSSDFSVGNGDFTVDLWFNPNAGNGTNRFLCGASDGAATVTTRTIELNLRTTNVMWGIVYVGSTQYVLQGTTTFLAASNVWHHAELSREGGTLRLFIDGILEASNNSIGTTSVNNAGTKFAWGNLGITANGYLGYIDEARFSKGIARHTSNFIPPTVPYGTPVTFLSGKSLIADQGSYSLSGQDVTLTRTKYRAFQDKGDYSLIGNASTLRLGTRVNAANSTYSVTGNAQTLRYNHKFKAVNNTFTLTGKDVTFKIVLNKIDFGGYNIVGRVASLRYGHRIIGNGVYSVSGKNVIFKVKHVLAATKGTYAVTGKAITILGNRAFLLSSGTYSLAVSSASASYGLYLQKGIFSLTGNVNAFKATRKLYAVYSLFTLTGNPQTLRSNRKLYAAQGIYTSTGKAVAFKATRRLYAIYKLFTVTGQNVALRSAYRILAARNNFVLTGKAVSLRLDHRVISAGGSYLFNGKELILRTKRTVYLSKGTYTQTGIATTTVHKGVLLAARGIYSVTGKAITLRRQSYLNAAFAPYNLIKNNNFFKAKRTIYLAKGTYNQTGNTVSLIGIRRVFANKGNYTLVSTITLRVTHKLYADKGNYIFSGKAASMVVPFRIYPDRGIFKLTGNVAGLTKRSRLLALYSTFTINGQSVILREAHRHPIGQGTFSLAGKVASLRRDYHTNIDYGIFSLIRKQVSFLRKYVTKISQGIYRIDKPDTLLVKGSAFPGDYGVVGTPVTFIRSHKRFKAKAALVSGKPVAAAKQTLPIKRYAKLIDY